MDFKKWLWRNSLASGIAAAALAAFTLLLGMDIEKRAELIRVQRRNLGLQLRSIESLALLRKDAGKADQLFQSLQNVLPSKDQLINFSKNLETIAKDNRLGFGFVFGAESAGKDNEPRVTHFTLTSSGPYSSLLRFLRAIEGGEYLVKINSVDIIEKGNSFEMILRGMVFSQ